MEKTISNFLFYQETDFYVGKYIHSEFILIANELNLCMFFSNHLYSKSELKIVQHMFVKFLR